MARLRCAPKGVWVMRESTVSSRDIQQIELPIVRTGMHLETSSQIGFTMYIEGGEWSP